MMTWMGPPATTLSKFFTVLSSDIGLELYVKVVIAATGFVKKDKNRRAKKENESNFFMMIDIIVLKIIRFYGIDSY